MSPLPRLIDDLQFYPFDNGSEREEYVAATPDGRQFRISSMTKRVLEQLDGQTSLETVAERLSTPELVIETGHIEPVLARYRSMGLLESADGQEAPTPVHQRLRLVGFPFLLSFDLIAARWADGMSRLGQGLFSSWAALLALGSILLAHVYVYREPRPHVDISMDDYLWVVLLAVASILIHEVGHSSALKRFGGEPGPIGFGLYLLMPVFFADVSQLWRFSRARRMVVDLGGVYFQQLAFVALALSYAATGFEALRTTCFVIDFMVLMALNPIFRFDGYWLLVDYLSVPELQKVALKDLGGRLRALVSSHAAPSLPRGLQGLKRAVFHSYSVLAGGFLVVLMWIMTQYLSSAITTLPTIVPEAVWATWDAVRNGQPLAFVGKSVALFFVIAFPFTALVGLAFHAFRMVRAVLRQVTKWSRQLVRRRSGDASNPGSSTARRPNASVSLDRPLGRPSDP